MAARNAALALAALCPFPAEGRAVGQGDYDKEADDAGRCFLLLDFSPAFGCVGVRRHRGQKSGHSVLFLILSFVCAAGLFLLMGAEFLAMILVVVYVGAVAVLFLFVVMLLDVDFARLRQGFVEYLPQGC